MGGRGGRRARGGTGQRLMSGILSTRLFELPTPLLVLPGVSSAQVSWRPNIFGGQDCIGPEGRSSSTPNVFGGYDTTFPDGSRSSSHPNVFGDEDTTTPKGTIESRPNMPRHAAVDPQFVDHGPSPRAVWTDISRSLSALIGAASDQRRFDG